MYLPEHILACIQALENAGHSAYAVGGCVRDALLGRQAQDYDLCTDALPEQIKQVFPQRDLVLAGEKHGTVGVIFGKTVVEITTFRTEGEYLDNRHPQWVQFVSQIEADLARRDFTINAMAYSPTRGLADPFGGQADLKSHTLRAVGDPYARFREDSLRILRGARFAAKYDLTPEASTLEAMFALAPLMDNLSKERVFDELCKLIMAADQQQLCRFSPIIAQVIPELAPLIGFDQRSVHHTHDLFVHTAHAVSLVSPELSLRWAALLHDVGKPATLTLDENGQGHYYGHAAVSAQLANDILHRLKAPNALREQVIFLIEKHMALPEPEPKFLRRWLSRYGSERLQLLLQLQRADTLATGVHNDTSLFDLCNEIISALLAADACLSLKDLAISGQDLLDLGIPAGPAVGKCLNRLLEQVLDEQLPNTADALLEAAKSMEKNL